MNTLSNSVLSVMLGWVRGVAGSIWNLFTGQGAAWLHWIMDNWITLTVLLLVGCTVIDLLVYILRWRPQHVWFSFFRRRTRHQSNSVAQGRVVSRRWLYADGSSREEIIPEEELPVEEAPVVSARQIPEPAPLPPAEPVAPEADQPKPMLKYRQELENQNPAPRRRRSDVYSAPAAAPARSLRRFFADPDESENDILHGYSPAQSVEGYSERFNEPYYPPQYQQNNKQTPSDPS